MSLPETLDPSRAPAVPRSPLTPLPPTLSVTAQIDETVLEHAARAGFRLVICNRPDGEEAGQPSSTFLPRRAEALGIGFLRIPVSPGRFPEQDVAACRTAVTGTDGSVLAFCRSGTRSASLAASPALDETDPERSIRAVEAAEYDLSQVRVWLSPLEGEAGPIESGGC